MSSDFDGWFPISSTLEFRVCVSASEFPSISERVETSPASLIALWFNNYWNNFLAFPVLRLLRPAVGEKPIYFLIHPSIHQSHVSLQEYVAPFKYSFILPQYFAAAAAASVRLITTGWSSPRQHSFRLFDPLLLFGFFFFLFQLGTVDVVRHH
jgi:hypothetical protein